MPTQSDIHYSQSGNAFLLRTDDNSRLQILLFDKFINSSVNQLVSSSLNWGEAELDLICFLRDLAKQYMWHSRYSPWDIVRAKRWYNIAIVFTSIHTFLVHTKHSSKVPTILCFNTVSWRSKTASQFPIIYFFSQNFLKMAEDLMPKVQTIQ